MQRPGLPLSARAGQCFTRASFWDGQACTNSCSKETLSVWSVAAGKVERTGEACVWCASKITFSCSVFISVLIWITSARFCS